MKICFIGSADSSHIAKWCSWFSNHGHEVHLISLTDPNFSLGKTFFHKINIRINFYGNDFHKIKCYLLAGIVIKRYIRNIKPDIINVHYASGYGIATALSGIKNYILSVWGSDIYDFPTRSFIHKELLRYSLSKPTYLFSTSKAMANEAVKYTNRKFEITPFGVDTMLFNPDKRIPKNNGTFTVGTVKRLMHKYGISYMLKAISILKKEYPALKLYVRIAGDGPQQDEYERLVHDLDIQDITTFLGKITQEEAAIEWANMDIAIIPSLSESFGVAALEAQASGVPVIISDADGLLETTYPGKSSIVIPKSDEKAIADAIIRLLENPELRRKMGVKGRGFVEDKYEINKNFIKIENLFLSSLNGSNAKQFQK